jgi:hypothetical protein
MNGKEKEFEIALPEDASPADENAEVTYISKCEVEGKALAGIELNQTQIFLRGCHDLDPHIFYRVRGAKRELPAINLANYFPLSQFKGITVEITPDFSFEKSKEIVNKNLDSYKEIEEQVQKFPKSCDNELKEVIEKHIADNSIDFITNKDVTIEAHDLKIKGKKLKGLSDKNKQMRVNALLELNKAFIKTIPFVFLEEEALKEMQ